jgi:AcrR family transcriptional regulator
MRAVGYAPARMADPGTAAPRRWRGLERDERDAQRRRRLLDAGLELFGTAGYGATSIEALCAKANVATRSLYELFGGRDQLLVALYDELIAEIGEGVWAALDQDSDDLRKLVRDGVAAYLEPLVADERKGRVTQLEVVGISGDLETHRREAIRAFAAGIDERLERWQQRGLVEVRSGGLLTLVMSGGASEVLVDHLITPKRRRRPVRELVDELTRIWLLVLSGRP